MLLLSWFFPLLKAPYPLPHPLLRPSPSITIDGETKIFRDKNKCTPYLATKPALQRITDGKYKSRRETTPQKKQQSNLSTNRIENSHRNIKIISKITGSSNHYSLLSLNINGLNSLRKRYRITDWMQKQDPTFWCKQETHLSVKESYLPQKKSAGK